MINFKKISHCPVCAGKEFKELDVLWENLIDEWELQPFEVEYVNRQQGCTCSACGNNLRSLALADAILNRYNFKSTLNNFVLDKASSSLKVLEINEAGGLTPTLSKLPNHLLIKYPEYDMADLPFDVGSFDLVIHSDTLEHVQDPIKGLSECKRILKPNGACIYTVPIVLDRKTRSRKGLKPSFHGSQQQNATDQIVHTEFGDDAWKWPIFAGFKSTTIHSFEYPAALTIEAR